MDHLAVPVAHRAPFHSRSPCLIADLQAPVTRRTEPFLRLSKAMELLNPALCRHYTAASSVTASTRASPIPMTAPLGVLLPLTRTNDSDIMPIWVTVAPATACFML